MDVKAVGNERTFGAKFIKNKAFEEVVRYAKKTSRIKDLDSALNNLANANPGDILIIHGKTQNCIFSNFNLGKRCFQNLVNDAKTPEEASFNAIIELGELGRKFRRLIGGNVKFTLKAEDLIKRYTV